MRTAPKILVFLLAHVLWLPLVMAQSGSIHGFVQEQSSRETLPGANVILLDSRYGTTTNTDGFYALTHIPYGAYTLLVSYVGYESVRTDITLDRSTLRLDIELPQKTIALNEVEVIGERLERQLNIQMGRVVLNTRQIASIPQIGEADLFRALQALPGVLSQSDFSTGLIIRGGNTDQNLILLDGITVYNPSHLGGLFSNFIVDAVKEADLVKGGFNAEYGGRMSAVLNVTSRDGSRERLRVKGGLSLLSAHSIWEGPVGQGAWLVAARRTWFDQVFKGTRFYFPYYFYDFQGHLFQDFSARDRLSVSSYLGQDRLDWNEFGFDVNWGNRTISGTWRRIMRDDLYSRFMVAGSNFYTHFNLGGSSGVSSNNDIYDITVREDLSYYRSNDLHFKGGVELKSLSFTYQDSYKDSVVFNPEQSPLELSTYLQARWRPVPVFIIEPGLRLTYFDEHRNKFYLDPRLRFKYFLSEDLYINGAAGVYHQYMQTVQDDYNPTIIDFWFAVDPSTRVARSYQYILGLELYTGGKYRFNIEGYYKTMQNILTFLEQRSAVDETISDDQLASSFYQSDGTAFGMEFFLQKSTGRLNGWIAYTFGLAKKFIDEKEYYTNWDRRHASNLILNYHLSHKWQAGLSWTYQSGQPYTPILGTYAQNLPGESETYYRTVPGERNSLRYIPYHRLDLSLTRHFNTRVGNIDVYVQVINTYWRKNIFRYLYLTSGAHNGLDDDGDWKSASDDTGIDGIPGTGDYGEGNGMPDYGEPHVDESDENRTFRRPINMLPILPTIGFTIEFK